MITLTHLQQSLQREMPICAWHCHPAENAQTISASSLPSDIEITAMLSGKPLPGSPFRLSGTTLVRWGADATARFICGEFPPLRERIQMRSRPGWDKLAEI